MPRNVRLSPFGEWRDRRGYTQRDVQQLVSRRFGFMPSQCTVSNWCTETSFTYVTRAFLQIITGEEVKLADWPDSPQRACATAQQDTTARTSSSPRKHRGSPKGSRRGGRSHAPARTDLMAALHD